MSDAKNDDDGAAVGVRWPELLVALGFMVLAAVVMWDSRRIGAGWADDGPQSGYFPFSGGASRSSPSARRSAAC